jgi:penicillin-binding protein 2
LNKAIQAQLAPGSTFKILMSVAGLEENVAQTLKVNCGGGATFYGHFFACDARHGPVNINNAIPLSCDTYYYTLAQRLGIETIAKWAHRLGLGSKTGIDLPNEASGVMPSEEWKMKTFHEKWYAGETISVGIGQGAVAVTPMQLARAIGGIASGGALKRPHVVFPQEIPAQYHEAILDTFAGSGDQAVQLSTAAWETITDGMAETTIGSGTAHASHLEGIDFAGKTGTAQVVSHSFGAKGLGSKNERTNAWFVGVAPRRNPDIVVAVLWEHGGWGAGSAHLAAQVIETFVDKQRRLQHNLPAPAAQQVEVGAVYSAPGEQDSTVKAGEKPKLKPTADIGPAEPAPKPAPKKADPVQPTVQPTAMRGMHFFLPISPTQPAASARGRPTPVDAAPQLAALARQEAHAPAH